ncbi:MAG: hypothetical protein IKZ45_05965 [Fibrobacter sp.]|nr:hypothetical protein [Fibrobacter sp.]
MKNIRLISAFSAIAFAVAVPFTFVACGDDSSSAKDETPSSSSNQELSEMECDAENEGSYKTVLDTLTVYESGNAMVWNKYYHCESGEWVETECRDPQDACTGDNEGEYKDVVCGAQLDNPKSPKTTWTFKCTDNKWKKLTDEEKSQLNAEKDKAEVEESCTKPETKLGDVCGITKQGGNVSFGTVIYTLVCYVYTEEGWVAKWSGIADEKGCNDVLNPPADSTAAE